MENIQIIISRDTLINALYALKVAISNDIELYGKDSDNVIEDEKAYNDLLNAWRFSK